MKMPTRGFLEISRYSVNILTYSMDGSLKTKTIFYIPDIVKYIIYISSKHGIEFTHET